MDSSLYTPLDSKTRQIRLLRLPPASPEAPFECELIVRSLDNEVEYEALSYVWGERYKQGKVELPIKLSGQEVYVTMNLWAALKCLRIEDRDRLLWVDALCIDQRSIGDKNQQLPLMRDIYEGATRVFAWLGWGSDEIEKQVEVLQKYIADPGLPLYFLKGSKEDRKRKKEELRAITYFLRRPWWDRIWTVQEAVLARELVFMLGRHTIPGDQLFLLTDRYFDDILRGREGEENPQFEIRIGFTRYENVFNPATDLNNVFFHLSILNHYRRSRQRVDFLELISIFRLREATDPRDKVFGLLGIAKGIADDIIDYAIPLSEVYLRTARHLIESTKSLDVLSQVLELRDLSLIPPEQMERALFPQLPSWVPNWNAEYRWSDIRNAHMRLEFIKHYSTSGSTVPDFSSLSEGKLALQGIHVDTVALLGLESTQINDVRAVRDWRELVKLDLEPGKMYVTRKSDMFDAFWRTICGDIATYVVDGKRFPAGSGHRILHDLWWYDELRQKDEPRVKSALSTEEEEQHIAAFQRQSSATYGGRRFIVSAQGYIGLAPSSTKVGDRITVLFGGKVPLILRNSYAEADYNAEPYPQCRLVGDAYIHGLMTGEALELLKSARATLHTFVLG